MKQHIVLYIFLMVCLPTASQSDLQMQESFGESEQFSSFMDAVFCNDIATVKQKLDSGMICNWRTETGLSPLMLAAIAGYDSLALLLLNHGSRIPPALAGELAIGNSTLGLLRWAGNNGGLALEYGNYFRTPLCLGIKVGATDSVIAYLLTSANYKSNYEYCDALFRTLVDTRMYRPIDRTLSYAYRLLEAGVPPYACALAEIGYAAGDSALVSKYFCPGARERAIERSTLANLRSHLKRRDIEKLDSLLAAGVAVDASFIFSVIVKSQTDCPYGTLVDAPRHITSVLFLLNKYLNQGVTLHTVLKPGSTETIGLYQIGFESQKVGFRLVWKVLPCYSKPGSQVPLPLEMVNRLNNFQRYCWE
jgi:hypothetical protein